EYAEETRQTLRNWGRMPHLVRAGKAHLAIALANPERYEVWALAPSGRRLARIAVTVEGGALRFTADVAGDARQGARMLHEVAVK
ncbi:MAG TPA: hypothetical protein PK640_19150, partial [Verrucomicrobiota bacterium]|nr:hypothetical protein [Verrucomicrobiota bacterium]